MCNEHFYCPNEECKNHENPQGSWYIKKGTFTPEWSEEKVLCYQCKTCKSKFSDSTFKDTYRQKKPQLNEEIFKWYCSGATQRRIAKNLKTTQVTVVRKFRLLADKARVIHAGEVLSGNLNTNIVHFDEQETFERTKKLPISIAIAVDGTHSKDGGRVIDINVAQMPAKGYLAKLSHQLYGYRRNDSPLACKAVLNTVKIATNNMPISINTDAKPAYKTYVADILENAFHRSIDNSEQKERVSRNEPHPLWWVNQACGSTRHELSRMRRRTCVTTKDLHELRRHLWLFVTSRNGYAADLLDPLYKHTKYKRLQEQFTMPSFKHPNTLVKK